MKEFAIDIAFCDSVSKITYHSLLENKHNPTPQDLVKIIRGEDKITSFESIDHPMFTKLREQLAADGFIEIDNGSWNRDTVLSPFKLNGVLFKTGDRFPCASAIKYDLSHK